MRMLLALFRARFADVGAQRADALNEFAVARHHNSRNQAHGAAILVELDAGSKHLHVLFIQALVGALLAGRGAFIAGSDTGVV